MAFIRLPGGFRIALEYQIFGKIVVNVYHGTTTDPITSIKLFSIADLFEAWFDTSLASAVSADIKLAQITVLNLDEENGEKVTNVLVPANPGTRAGAAMPNNVALVASFATAKTGRSFRGRSYIAGLSEDDVGGVGVDTVFAAGIVTAFLALITDMAVDDEQLVVASFQSGGVPREVGVATPVDSVSCNLRVDTQRRRLPS